MTTPFWQQKTLEDFTQEEWESLCDGCARCCLIKLEDEDSGQICTTNVVCRYLDLTNCQCREYEQRSVLVPECVTLTAENIAEQFHYMPQSCSYRILYETGTLPNWHPLLRGSQVSMQEAGLSVASIAISEATLTTEDELFDHIVDCDE